MTRHDPNSPAYQKRKAQLAKTLEAFLASPDFEAGVLAFACQTPKEAYENQASRVELRTDGTWHVAFHYEDPWHKFILPIRSLWVKEEDHPLMKEYNMHSLYEAHPDIARELFQRCFARQREYLANELRRMFQGARERGE